jgi:hypothetical protein
MLELTRTNVIGPTRLPRNDILINHLLLFLLSNKILFIKNKKEYNTCVQSSTQTVQFILKLIILMIDPNKFSMRIYMCPA